MLWIPSRQVPSQSPEPIRRQGTVQQLAALLREAMSMSVYEKRVPKLQAVHAAFYRGEGHPDPLFNRQEVGRIRQLMHYIKSLGLMCTFTATSTYTYTYNHAHSYALRIYRI